MSKNNEPDKPLSDDGADALHAVRAVISSKAGREATASDYVTRMMNQAIDSLTEQDRTEVVRRLQKLFFQQFKTTEVGDQMIAQTRDAALDIASRVIEIYRPQMETALRGYMEANFERLVEAVAKNTLERVLLTCSKQFFKTIALMAEQQAAEQAQAEATDEGIPGLRFTPESAKKS